MLCFSLHSIRTDPLEAFSASIRSSSFGMAFQQSTDALLWLGRTLLRTPGIHYVDDLGAVEIAAKAVSSFQAFEKMCDILGFRLKPSKQQPPNKDSESARRLDRNRGSSHYSQAGSRACSEVVAVH